MYIVHVAIATFSGLVFSLSLAGLRVKKKRTLGSGFLEAINWKGGKKTLKRSKFLILFLIPKRLGEKLSFDVASACKPQIFQTNKVAAECDSLEKEFLWCDLLP